MNDVHEPYSRDPTVDLTDWWRGDDDQSVESPVLVTAIEMRDLKALVPVSRNAEPIDGSTAIAQSGSTLITPLAGSECLMLTEM